MSDTNNAPATNTYPNYLVTQVGIELVNELPECSKCIKVVVRGVNVQIT